MMNIHKASILLCSRGMRHPPLTSLTACAGGPSNAPSLFSVTSSAAAHRPMSSKSKKKKKTLPFSFREVLYSQILLYLFKNPLQWRICGVFLKQTFKKGLLFRNIPYKSVFRYINTTQKSSLSETSRMLVSKDMWNQDEKQQNIKSKLCPLSSSSILPAYDVNLKQQKQGQGHWLKHWSLFFLEMVGGRVSFE